MMVDHLQGDEIFGTVFAGVYDGIYADKDYQAECDLVERLLRGNDRPSVRSILDIGCGTGAHGFDLARRGFEVTGIDISPNMLAVAAEKERTFGGPGPIRFQQADMRTFDLGCTFDAALIMFSVLGYPLTDEGIVGALERVHRHLRPSGLLVFDIWYGPAVIAHEPQQRTKRVPVIGGEVVRTSSGRLHRERHVCEINFDFKMIRDGVETGHVREHHEMRYFFELDLDRLLKEGGFELMNIGPVDDFERAPDSSERDMFALAVAV